MLVKAFNEANHWPRASKISSRIFFEQLQQRFNGFEWFIRCFQLLAFLFEFAQKVRRIKIEHSDLNDYSAGRSHHGSDATQKLTARQRKSVPVTKDAFFTL